jgi:hypothetical protein
MRFPRSKVEIEVMLAIAQCLFLSRRRSRWICLCRRFIGHQEARKNREDTDQFPEAVL